MVAAGVGLLRSTPKKSRPKMTPRSTPTIPSKLLLLFFRRGIARGLRRFDQCTQKRRRKPKLLFPSAAVGVGGGHADARRQG